jgi:hypothetical protein
MKLEGDFAGALRREDGMDGTLRHWVFRTTLGGLLFAPAMLTGCAVHAGYYDVQYRDYHRWGPEERPHYDAWVAETHHERVGYGKLNDRDKQAYWSWRHTHP